MTAAVHRGKVLLILAAVLVIPLAVGFLWFGLRMEDYVREGAGNLLRRKAIAFGLFGPVPVCSAWGLWRGYSWAKSILVIYCGVASLVLAGLAATLFVGWALLDGKVWFGLALAAVFATPAVLYGTVAYLVAVSPSVHAFLEHRRGSFGERRLEKEQQRG